MDSNFDTKVAVKVPDTIGAPGSQNPQQAGLLISDAQLQKIVDALAPRKDKKFPLDELLDVIAE